MMVTLQGSVEFIDSNEFRIEVSAESSSVEQLARFRYNFTDFHGSLLLQMVRTTMLHLYIVFCKICTALRVSQNCHIVQPSSTLPFSEDKHARTCEKVVTN